MQRVGLWLHRRGRAHIVKDPDANQKRVRPASLYHDLMVMVVLDDALTIPTEAILLQHVLLATSVSRFATRVQT